MQNLKDISIQVSLNGFSFLMLDSLTLRPLREASYRHCNLDYIYSMHPELCDGFRNATIRWNVTEVQMVPKAMFDPQFAEVYMRRANLVKMGLEKSITLMDDVTSSEFVALWQAPEHLYVRLCELIPTAQHTHPLLDTANVMATEQVMIDTMDPIAHIKVFNRKGLAVAESIEFQTPEEVMLALNCMAFEDTFAQYQITITGDRALFLGQFLEQYYRRITY